MLIILESVKKYYEARVLEYKTNIRVFMVHPSGVADHGNIVETVSDLIGQLSEAEDRLSTVINLLGEFSREVSSNDVS